MKCKLICLMLAVAAFLLGGCSIGQGGTTDVGIGDTLTSEAELLTLIDCGDYVVAEIRDPWHSDAVAERFVLVDSGVMIDVMPEGRVINVPLRRSVVYSGVHGGIIDELGATGRIAGVADGRYFTNATIVKSIAEGRIRDVGNSMSPSVEAIVDLDPDAILLSPMQNQEAGAVDRLGVAMIGMVDYMERTPLGRAEWIKLIGRLYGCGAEADSIFEVVGREYAAICDEAGRVSRRPVVITEQPLAGGSWDMPAGESYMARMLADAGGDYPWASTDGAGSVKLDVAAVLDRAKDADYWLIRSYGPLTREALQSSSPLLGQFEALKKGGVYVCDTSRSPLFDEFPFHPERLLREYFAIFHPDISVGGPLRYYEPLK